MVSRVNHLLRPIVNENSEILILGSLPSVKSREYNFYYMHPQNRFWKLLELIFQDEFTTTDILKKNTLLINHKIALYDVIESCEIDGSKDSSIKNVIPSDILSLIEGTNIKKIYLNGKKAYNLFVKYNSSLKDYAVYLPSTSPANASFSLEKLQKYWGIIKK